MGDENLSERVNELEDLVNINDDKSGELADCHAGWLIANQALIFALIDHVASQSEDKRQLLQTIWSRARSRARDKPLFSDVDPDDADLYHRLATDRIDILIARLATLWGLSESQA